MADYIYIYDTTLRDGAQTGGVDFSVADKQEIALKLDMLNIDYIEGGWNGANPTDTAFFSNLPKLNNAEMTVFGMTKRFKKEDKAFDEWAKTTVNIFTVVGKTWDFHVTEALNITLEQNLKTIEETIKILTADSKQVFFDAEHFFDGFKNNEEYALKCIETAYKAGARWIVLCDTNGGTMPGEIEEIIKKAVTVVPGEYLGIHCHNDTGHAVANTLTAVQAGVRQVQGTINGLGERCGNADLTTVIPNLVFKMGYKTGLTAGHLKKLTAMSRFLYEKLNMPMSLHQPYVGVSAFAHKGGLHVSAMNKDTKSYEHISPDLIGNARKILVSGQAGRSNIISLLKQIQIELPEDDTRINQLLKMVKEKEHQGFSYDECLASFEVLARSFLFGLPPIFSLEAFRVIDERRYNEKGILQMVSDATVRLRVGDKSYIEADTGIGPVDALANTLFKVLLPIYPELKDFKLMDYRVRIFQSDKGTAAVTRVMIDSKDSTGHRFSTVGISPDIIDASFQALSDAILYKYYCVKS